MKTTKTTTKQSVRSTSSNATATPARKKIRKPPVAERVTATGATAPPVAVALAPATAPTPAVAATPPPVLTPAVTPTPAAGPALTPAPAAAPAPTPSPSGGSSDPGTAEVSAPPPLTLPSVPSGFVPANMTDFRGYRPMASEIAAVPDTVNELQAFTDYGTVFGITAPPADQLVGRIAVAAQWTSVLSQTSAWVNYVKSEEGMAWKDALLLVEKMKPAFQLASAANPALLTQYPALARLLGASQVVAKRAVATKKRTKAAATASAAAAATGTPGAATTPAAAVNGANGAATPARVVTVTG